MSYHYQIENRRAKTKTTRSQRNEYYEEDEKISWDTVEIISLFIFVIALIVKATNGILY